MMACATIMTASGDGPLVDQGVRVEIPRDPQKVAEKRIPTKATRDSKDTSFEINHSPNTSAQVQLNGRVADPHARFRGRYLFGQEEVEPEEPPLPPSQFNPDPGGGNLLEPEPPPDLFPPILPQPPEYGDETVPRSLGLPRRGVRETM